MGRSFLAQGGSPGDSSGTDSPYQVYATSETPIMNGLIRFALRNPRAITVLMLTIVIAGVMVLGLLPGTKALIPSDILPVYRSPAVQVLTFYNGMPATSVEADITSRMERWTGQAAGTSRQESRSIIGASIIRNYYSGDTDPSAALTQVNSLATAAIPNLPRAPSRRSSCPTTRPLRDARLPGRPEQPDPGRVHPLRLRPLRGPE
jgi:Cu/Ag efflux pump CusA